MVSNQDPEVQTPLTALFLLIVPHSHHVETNCSPVLSGRRRREAIQSNNAYAIGDGSLGQQIPHQSISDLVVLQVLRIIRPFELVLANAWL